MVELYSYKSTLSKFGVPTCRSTSELDIMTLNNLKYTADVTSIGIVELPIRLAAYDDMDVVAP